MPILNILDPNGRFIVIINAFGEGFLRHNGPMHTKDKGRILGRIVFDVALH
jgi:hypothetical protein